MRVLALVPWAELEKLTQDFAGHAHDILRGPEIGLVMLRGRIGGSGAPFNFGEATVTRCTVRLADGTEGHAYVMGRNGEHAKRAALCDALLQTETANQMRAIISQLELVLQQRKTTAAAKAAATKVDFFTLVRGDV